MAVCACGDCTSHMRDPLYNLPRWMERVETLEPGSLAQATDGILTTDAIEDVIKHPGTEHKI